VRLRPFAGNAHQIGVVERARTREYRMRDGNLVLGERDQQLARRLREIGQTLRQLGARDRLDLVEHQGDDVVEQLGLAR
jgi:hypothetical protein